MQCFHSVINMKSLLNQLLIAVAFVNCARILVVNPTSSYSHQMVTYPIAKELSKKNHEVVLITTHPIRDKNLPNLNVINITLPTTMQHKMNIFKRKIFNEALEILETCTSFSDVQLKHPEMQKLINNKTEHFDLVIIECLIPTMMAFKVRFNCPSIVFSVMDGQNSDHKYFGNFDNPALFPSSFVYDRFGTGFLQRVFNVFTSIVLDLHREYILYPLADKIIKSHFGKSYPHSRDIFADADMFFAKSNIMLGDIRPITPSTIEIGGGIHLKEAEELPKILKTFLDNSIRGVVYINFGSNMESSKFSAFIIKQFLEAIEELKYDFLWKFEDETVLPYKPNNVLVIKWIPQQDVLRHKNVKLFITHAGLQSSQEGLHFYVPMLAIPFFGDQIYNAYKIAEKNIGLVIEDINEVTSEQLILSISEIIENVTYSRNIRKLGKIAIDQPMKPIENAIWWTEYVLRHKGAKHLKGPFVPFYQRYLFDVLVFFVLLLVLILLFMLKLFSYFRKCYRIPNKLKTN